MAPLPQFILFGDSLTQGANDQSKGFALASEIQHAYCRRWDVINRGFSGYTSDHGLQVVSEIMPTPAQADVKFMTIWFGANDANTNPEQNQHVPLDRFKSNLISIIKHPAVVAQNPNIILVVPSPFEETVLKEFQEAWGYSGPVRRAVDAQEYAQAVRDVGKETGVVVLDAWKLCMDKAGWKEGEVLPGSAELGKNAVLADLLMDGLHMSPSGYKLVYDEFVRIMKEKWPEYPPYKMPFVVKVPWEIEMGDKFWDVNNDA